MKIINSHCHIIELEKVLGNQDAMKLIGSIPAFSKELEQTIDIINVDEVLNQMDEAGIDQTILFALECPILYSSNEYVASLCEKHPDRFIGFASVNPLEKGAADKLEKLAKEFPFKGVKFHPPLQNFYPNDSKVNPVYEVAQSLGLPVVFHVGTTPFGHLTKLAQADPLLLDEVACNFPEMKIILTHLGTLWSNEAFMVTEKNPNVYIDTAAYPYEITELMTQNLVSRVGEDKFIFGTDFPMPYEDKLHRMSDFVKCINDLALSDSVKKKIFSSNLENILPK